MGEANATSSWQLIDNAGEGTRSASVGAFGDKYGAGWDSSDDESGADAYASFAIYDSLSCRSWSSTAVRYVRLCHSKGWDWTVVPDPDFVILRG